MEKKDAVVLEAIKQLEPVEINKCGAKRKSQLLKRKGIPVNHKRVARICKEAGIETTNRRRKFPKNYDKRYEEAIKQSQELNLVQSMSRKGNCWDNACMKRFFGTVKSETNYYDTLKNGLLSYKEMERMILEFIEYYNNRRIQKKLNWMTPIEFRSKRCY